MAVHPTEANNQFVVDAQGLDGKLVVVFGATCGSIARGVGLTPGRHGGFVISFDDLLTLAKLAQAHLRADMTDGNRIVGHREDDR